jgi:hypothetical protein
VWRPLNLVVTDCPLSLCDPRSVDLRNILEVDKVHPDHVDEGGYLTHSPSQKWLYLSNQTKDEATVFCTFDPDTLGKEIFSNPRAFRAACDEYES